MKKSKVKSYKIPSYPARDLFVLNPGLLKKYVPQSWKKNKLVWGALAAFVLGGYNKAEAAAKSKEEMNQNQTQISGESLKNNSLAENETERSKAAKVAPVFINGEGRGALGCVVISPPVFLSEEEAREIITGELKKENIIFDKIDMPVEEITFMETFEQYDWGAELPLMVKDNALVLDGLDTKHNLGYEYISREDYFPMGGERSNSTVQAFDVKRIAQNARDKLEDYAKINAVVFYDPMEEMVTDSYSEDAYEQAFVSAKQKAAEKLKAQVRDFVEWIKKEGILNEDKK